MSHENINGTTGVSPVSQDNEKDAERQTGRLSHEEIIFSYTRADAIADGVLVDLLASPETASVVREAGFRLPIAMTSAAYEALIGTGELPSGQSVSGRLWDVLMVLRSMIRRLPDGADRVDFSVFVWDGTSLGDVACWCHCGPGDEGEPVLTIMLQGED